MTRSKGILPCKDPGVKWKMSITSLAWFVLLSVLVLDSFAMIHAVEIARFVSAKARHPHSDRIASTGELVQPVKLYGRSSDHSQISTVSNTNAPGTLATRPCTISNRPSATPNPV